MSNVYEKYNCLEKHVFCSDVTFVQLPLPIFENELTSQERNMHSAYWGKLTNLVPNSFFSPDKPIFNFMEVGIGLPSLSGEIQKAGYSFSLIDLVKYSGSSQNYEQIKAILREAGESRVYLLSPMTCGYEIFRNIVFLLKEIYPESKIVAGGPHVSKLPKETLLDIPSLDVALSDQVFNSGEIVQALLKSEGLDLPAGCFINKNGKILSTNRTHSKANVKGQSLELHLDLDILPSRYSESSWARVYTSLGCAFNCTYCADVLHKEKEPNFFNIDKTIEQIMILKNKFNICLFYIGDETFTYNKKHALEFTRRIGEIRDIYWIAQTRADCIDIETAESLAENNCILLKFGAETSSPEILNKMNKGLAPGDIETAARLCKQAGLNVFTYWMTGLPGETTDTINKTMEMQSRLFDEGICDLAEDVIFVPYPGTGIFNSPEKYEVQIEKKPWKEWREDMPSVLSTKSLSSNQIYQLWLNKIDNLSKLIKG